MLTSQMNISKQDISGVCHLKCAYNFDYLPSDTVCTNNGTSIQLSYESTSSAPVLFNNLQYNVNTIYIYSPSVHTYNGATTNAEFIIEHLPVLTGDMLYVCVPVTQSTQTTVAGNTLTNIITSVSNNAPSVNETTTLNSTFNLSEFVPLKSFVNYTGTSGFNGQVIAFSLVDAIPLSSDTLTTLSSIIQPSTLTITGESLYLNPRGPNSSTAGDGIYISCTPTGNSEDETDVSYTTSNPINFSSILKSSLLRSVLVAIVFIIFFYMISYLIKNYGN